MRLGDHRARADHDHFPEGRPQPCQHPAPNLRSRAACTPTGPSGARAHSGGDARRPSTRSATVEGGRHAIYRCTRSQPGVTTPRPGGEVEWEPCWTLEVLVAMGPKPFTVQVPAEVLDDLRSRL